MASKNMRKLKLLLKNVPVAYEPSPYEERFKVNYEKAKLSKRFGYK